MVLSDVCSLRLLREAKVPLKGLFQSPSLYMLRSEMCALVTVGSAKL